VLSSVTLQACAIINLVGFIVVLVVGLAPIPANWTWHR
jgi:hypothetical protein